MTHLNGLNKIQRAYVLPFTTVSAFPHTATVYCRQEVKNLLRGSYNSPSAKPLIVRGTGSGASI
jgi:hypothetical protein